MKKIILLFLLIFILGGCSKSEPQLEINLHEYLEYQEEINNNQLEIDLESYMYCIDSTTVYNDPENNETVTECKKYEISIKKLLDDIIYATKQK